MQRTETHSDDGAARPELFEQAAARCLREAVSRARAGEVVTVDLTPFGELPDFGVAALAAALQGSKARVVLRGLRHHQLRLLRYMGIDDGRGPAAEPPLHTAEAF
jgi:hypothetical protein